MRCLSVALFMAAAGPVLADGGVAVPLPTIPPMSTGVQEHMLMQLVVANVVSQSCIDYQGTPEEWALLTGSADLIADALGLDPGSYDDRFYGPAFALFDKPDTCEREGPRVRPLINRLIAWGGSLTPLP